MAEKTLRERLIGAWSLASYEERPVDGSTSFHPMSKTPKGIIMYSADGFMSAQLSQPDRKPFASGDWFRLPTMNSRMKRQATSPILALSMSMRKSNTSRIRCSYLSFQTGSAKFRPGSSRSKGIGCLWRAPARYPRAAKQ